jgi:hypothetical protein
VRDLSVAVVLAMAINRADLDDANLCVPFRAPCPLRPWRLRPAMARDRGLGPPAGPFRRTGGAP